MSAADDNCTCERVGWYGEGHSSGCAVSILADMQQQRDRLHAALARLEACPDLNLDDLEPETLDALREATDAQVGLAPVVTVAELIAALRNALRNEGQDGCLKAWFAKVKSDIACRCWRCEADSIIARLEAP